MWIGPGGIAGIWPSSALGTEKVTLRWGGKDKCWNPLSSTATSEALMLWVEGSVRTGLLILFFQLLLSYIFISTSLSPPHCCLRVTPFGKGWNWKSPDWFLLGHGYPQDCIRDLFAPCWSLNFSLLKRLTSDPSAANKQPHQARPFGLQLFDFDSTLNSSFHPPFSKLINKISLHNKGWMENKCVKYIHSDWIDSESEYGWVTVSPEGPWVLLIPGWTWFRGTSLRKRLWIYFCVCLV